jgi:hypothetical protein
MVTVRSSGLRALAVLGALVLGACASKGAESAATASASGPPTTEAPATSLRPISTTSPATTMAVAPSTTVVVAPSTTVPGMTTVALNGFVSPSGNIACAMSAASARCDLQTRTWSLPPRPANCEFDWGGSLKVTGQGPGFLACTSDSPFGVTAVLAYGTRSVIGSMACTSAETGMTCRNTVTGHGFSVSRDDYSVF